MITVSGYCKKCQAEPPAVPVKASVGYFDGLPDQISETCSEIHVERKRPRDHMRVKLPGPNR